MPFKTHIHPITAKLLPGHSKAHSCRQLFTVFTAPESRIYKSWGDARNVEIGGEADPAAEGVAEDAGDNGASNRARIFVLTAETWIIVRDTIEASPVI
jgi:hypothetical protein